MPSDLFLEIFAEEHALYRAHKAAWAREERRLFGGDAVLPELAQWKGETDDFYAVRTASASYLELPHKHASILVGHLRRKAPPLNYGTGMGEVRARDKITRPTLSELFDYNCDGVGSDGSQLAAWLDGLQERACATGHRYVLVDMPDQATLRAIRRAGDRAEVGPVTFQDQVEGFRPYLVEYSPLAVPNWEETKGVLQWAVLRVPVSPAKVVDDQGRRARTATEPGYLVLVRKGYQGLGAKHQNGGWWLFDAE
ncbi:MAG TPA: hypothetical protein VEB59_03880, partial [Gemmatimonadales bacterium]|nr:hypothetical protein [Gemmatimonadales bacterium]